jgi:hypothetical protein
MAEPELAGKTKVASWALRSQFNEGFIGSGKPTVRVGARGKTIHFITMNRVVIQLKSCLIAFVLYTIE